MEGVTGRGIGIQPKRDRACWSVMEIDMRGQLLYGWEDKKQNKEEKGELMSQKRKEIQQNVMGDTSGKKKSRCGEMKRGQRWDKIRQGK